MKTSGHFSRLARKNGPCGNAVRSPRNAICPVRFSSPIPTRSARIATNSPRSMQALIAKAALIEVASSWIIRTDAFRSRAWKIE